MLHFRARRPADYRFWWRTRITYYTQQICCAVNVLAPSMAQSKPATPHQTPAFLKAPELALPLGHVHTLQGLELSGHCTPGFLLVPESKKQGSKRCNRASEEAR